MSWTQQASQVDLACVAGELGLPLGRGRALKACPACGAGGDRGCKAYRGRSGDRFKCYRCDVGGDVIDLVAYALNGRALPRGHSDDAASTRAWFAARGWCDPSDNYQGPPPVAKPKTAPEGRALRELQPPPREEVADLVRQCSAVTDDEAAVAWMRHRFGDVDLDQVVGRGVVGVLPLSARVPRWARMGRKPGRPWTELGYRILLPLYDHLGELRSVRVRHIDDAPPAGAPKAVPPKGCGARGLVMADRLACHLLQHAAMPAWWAGTPRLVVAEGEPQFLSWCLAMQGAAAVLGIFSGSWTDEIASRVPDGAEVLVCTDPDKSGDQYADRINTSLTDRCQVQRWAPTEMAHAC